MMTKQVSEKPSVDTTDELMKAIEHAQARVAEVYSSGRNTLIDQISQQEWDSWDASDELGLVSDPHGLEDDPVDMADTLEKVAA